MKPAANSSGNITTKLKPGPPTLRHHASCTANSGVPGGNDKPAIMTTKPASANQRDAFMVLEAAPL